MQAGLAFLEAGAARLKNTTDIIIKKMIILCKYIPICILPHKIFLAIGNNI